MGNQAVNNAKITGRPLVDGIEGKERLPADDANVNKNTAQRDQEATRVGREDQEASESA